MQAQRPTSTLTVPATAETAAAPPVPTTTRVRAVVLMVLGPLIALITGAGLAELLPQWLQAGADAADANPLEAERTVAALLLMAWVFLLGLVFTLCGWQLWRQGRFGRRVGWLAGGMVALLMATLPWVKRLFA